MKNLIRLALVGLALTLGTTSARAELVLNGSFENNTAGVSQFNLSNAAFNGFMANATAFGTAQEIDIVTGTDFGIAPQHGNWKVAIHTQANPANFDAFSLTLSSALTAGQSYDLSFYGASSPGGQLGNVEIGVSTTANSFGTLVFSGLPGTDVWTHFTTTFLAPNNGGFLTVRNALTPSIYNGVDNFSLNATAVPAPAGVLLAGMGVAGAFGLRRRFRKVAV